MAYLTSSTRLCGCSFPSVFCAAGASPAAGAVPSRLFQPNGLGWHRYRHPLRLGRPDEGTQVHVAVRGPGRTGFRLLPD